MSLIPYKNNYDSDDSDDDFSLYTYKSTRYTPKTSEYMPNRTSKFTVFKHDIMDEEINEFTFKDFCQKYNDKDCVKFIENNVHSLDIDALFVACFWKKEETCLKLLECSNIYPIDVEYQSQGGFNSMWFAIRNKWEKVCIKILNVAPNSINCTTYLGMTPLMAVCNCKMERLCLKFLETPQLCKLNQAIRCNGKTVYDVALQNNLITLSYLISTLIDDEKNKENKIPLMSTIICNKKNSDEEHSFSILMDDEIMDDEIERENNQNDMNKTQLISAFINRSDSNVKYRKKHRKRVRFEENFEDDEV